MKSRLIVALIALALVAGACTSDAPPPDAGDDADATPGDTPDADAGDPVEGGTFIYAMPSDIISLDTVESGGTTSTAIKNMIYEGLVELKTNQAAIEFEPRLATDWSVDGTAWTFNLRTDVEFHDGTPFNAAAVKAHFDRLLGPEEPVGARDFAPFLDSVEVVDDSTVVFHTTFEDPQFPLRLTGATGKIESPTAFEQLGTELARDPVGTGPFKFVEWVDAVHVQLERNESYWRGRPLLDGVIIRPMPEASSRVVAVQAGDIHLASEVQPEQVPLLQNDPSLVLEQWPTTRQLFIGLHNLKEPFDNPLVRQAMNYAIDWEAITASIYQGTAESIGGPIPPTALGFSDVSPFTYDPDRAQELLAEAGFPDGFETIFFSTVGTYLKDTELVQAIQRQLNAVGISSQIDNTEFARYIDLVRQPTVESELVVWLDSWASNSAADILRDRYHCDSLRPAGVNITGYCNPDVNALIEEAERELNEERRLQLLAEAQSLVAQDAPAIWGIAIQTAWVASSNVHGAVRTQAEGVWVDENTWIDSQ